MLDLGRPLHYALTYCKLFLQTPIPEAIFSRSVGLGSQSAMIKNLMDVVVLRSLGSILQDKPSALSRMSQFAMYVRSHYLRMPMRLLVPHLVRKQFVSKDDGR